MFLFARGKKRPKRGKKMPRKQPKKGPKKRQKKAQKAAIECPKKAARMALTIIVLRPFHPQGNLSESRQTKPKSGCIYRAPIDLEQQTDNSVGLLS